MKIEKDLIGSLVKPASFASPTETCLENLFAFFTTQLQHELSRSRDLMNYRNNYGNIEFLSSAKISDSGGLNSLVYVESKERLIVCDTDESVLKILDFEESLYPCLDESYSVFTQQRLREPRHMCLGRNDELFVSEHSNGDRILVFDS